MTDTYKRIILNSLNSDIRNYLKDEPVNCFEENMNYFHLHGRIEAYLSTLVISENEYFAYCHSIEQKHKERFYAFPL